MDVKFETLDEFRRRKEEEYLKRLLKIARTRAEAASIAGINRTHFYKLLKKHSIPPKEKRHAKSSISDVIATSDFLGPKRR